MSTTAELLEQINHIFVGDGEVSNLSDWTEQTIYQTVNPRIQQARNIIGPSVSISAGLDVARLLGECFRIARASGHKKLELESRSLLAHGIGRMLAPNRDECRRNASQRFLDIAEENARIGDRNSAAIDYTNSAICLLELHNPAPEELLDAQQLCQKSITMRKRGTADFAYGQMNLALAKRKALPFSREPDRTSAYKQILRELDRSLKVFKKFPSEPVAYKEIYHHNVLETLEDWLSFENNRSRNSMDSLIFDKVAEDANRVHLSPTQYIQALRSNPATLGLHYIPDHIPSDRDVLVDALPKIERIRERIFKAETYVANSRKDNTKLRLKLFRLQSILSPLDGTPAIPWGAMSNLWEERDRQTFFKYASDILQWDIRHDPDALREYRKMLHRLAECILHFRTNWSRSDVTDLLSRNPTTFRFAACELGRIGEWRAAFQLLEHSRGINSSRAWNEDPSEYDGISDEISWVHVTHSPSASYVFVRNGKNFTGAEFCALSGKVLASEFNNFVRGGLFRSEGVGRAAAERSADSIREITSPLADWIHDHTRDHVVLMPGGYYQGFPLWACGKLADGLTSGGKQITSAPSRVVALKNTNSTDRTTTKNNVFMAEASTVPGLGELPWSKREQDVVRRHLSEHFTVQCADATVGNVIEGIEKSQIFHFTGHSIAMPDPLDSALATYTGSVQVSSILEKRLHASLAVFGSCESGLAMNFTKQDEMLSIQTAAYYAGVGLVIGTVWPIADRAGFLFAANFYRLLGESAASTNSAPSGSDVIFAFSQTVAWMRSATVADASELAEEFDLEFTGETPTAKAFRFYDWAAFGLVGVDSDLVSSI